MHEHAELEGAEVGTIFRNDFWEARLDSGHGQRGAFRGSFGVQASAREFEAIGDEAFVPPTDNDAWAAFLFEEVGTGRWRGQLGLRHERQDSTALGQPDRSFNGTSAATPVVAGVVALMQSQYVAQGTSLPSPQQIKDRLQESAKHLATSNNGFDTASGFGRVNACQALQAGTCPAPTPPGGFGTGPGGKFPTWMIYSLAILGTGLMGWYVIRIAARKKPSE